MQRRGNIYSKDVPGGPLQSTHTDLYILPSLSRKWMAAYLRIYFKRIRSVLHGISIKFNNFFNSLNFFRIRPTQLNVYLASHKANYQNIGISNPQRFAFIANLKTVLINLATLIVWSLQISKLSCRLFVFKEPSQFCRTRGKTNLYSLGQLAIPHNISKHNTSRLLVWAA